MVAFGCAVVRQFEQMGVFTLNSSSAISVSRDKLRSMQIFSRHDIGLPPTAFVRRREDVLQLRALIAQRTGEDWRGVHLELSTAAPLSFTELPELSAIRIGRAQPPPPRKPGFRPPRAFL